MLLNSESHLTIHLFLLQFGDTSNTKADYQQVLTLNRILYILIADGTTGHLHQLSQFAYLLFADTFVHSIALNKIVFDNLASPNAESCTTFTFNTIANGNDAICATFNYTVSFSSRTSICVCPSSV